MSLVQTLLHIHNGILPLSNKKKENIDTSINLNGSQVCHSEWGEIANFKRLHTI